MIHLQKFQSITARLKLDGDDNAVHNKNKAVEEFTDGFPCRMKNCISKCTKLVESICISTQQGNIA